MTFSIVRIGEQGCSLSYIQTNISQSKGLTKQVIKNKIVTHSTSHHTKSGFFTISSLQTLWHTHCK